MCGIAGFITSNLRETDSSAILNAMTDAIAHRGPDDSGQWIDVAQGVALGHRRLSIIDLSPAGHQPMTSQSGRYELVFNGEIYNYHALRTKLEDERIAPSWRGRSDTEVLLACIEAWGIRGALGALNGMFAIAVWDRQDGRLTLARDRAGEKPLYYGRQGASILFASELKAIAVHPEFEKIIDRNAVAAFMRFAYVPSPLSIWQGIYKLPPAHMVEVYPGDTEPRTPECYWDIRGIASEGEKHPFKDTPELVDELDFLLRDAVKLRMEADVPLGSFLSGGVDSSAITALMQAQSDRPIKTFSIGFSERGYDESAYARAVAEHLGTDHCELRVDAAQAQDVLPKLPKIWDEPFADTSQIPTYLVSSLARREVTVALSGDGGDELFAGYNRHIMGPRIWEKVAHLPSVVRRSVAATLSGSIVRGTANGLVSLTGIGSKVAGLTERIPKIGKVIGANSPTDFYAQLVSQWPPEAKLVVGVSDAALDVDMPDFSDFRNTMLFLDSSTYLPDDILVKVDRAAMAVSLEGRIPFLDHRLMEFAWHVPMSAKIKNGRGKHILREVLYRYVPPALIDRPKAGFQVPIGDWLLGPLRDWAEGLLDLTRIRSQGLLNPAVVQSIWQRFQRGEVALLTQVWCVLTFQAWLEEQEISVAPSALH